MSAVAHAIEAKDAKFLSGLSGIGKRTAELMIAELSGKLSAFALAPHGGVATSVASHKRNNTEEDAILTLVALGERRLDAEVLLEKAKALSDAGTSTDKLVREMLRLRGGR